jgi:hypothetical protein
MGTSQQGNDIVGEGEGRGLTLTLGSADRGVTVQEDPLLRLATGTNAAKLVMQLSIMVENSCRIPRGVPNMIGVRL